MREKKKRIGLFILILFLATVATVYGQSDLTQQGITFLKAQRFNEAINVFSKVVNTDPANVKAIYYRGMAQYYKGNIDASIADYNSALKKDPNFVAVYTSRGVAHFRKGDFKQAQKDLDLALKKNPNDTNAINQKAWMLAVCPQPSYRDGKKALALARKVINIKATPNYLDTLAAAYAENGQYKEAVDVQRKVIALLTQEERLSRIDHYLQRLKKYETKMPWREGAGSTETRQEKKTVAGDKKLEEKEDVPKTEMKKVVAPSSLPEKKVAVTAPVSDQPQAAEIISKTEVQLKSVVFPAVSGRYPYTIFISTYQDPQISKTKALSLRKNGDPVFVSHAYFKDSGHWYQVYYGWYKRVADAKKMAENLEKRHFRKSIVVKKPFAIQAGISSSQAALIKIEKKLRALNYPSYRIPDMKHPQMDRILIGAYSTQTVPDKLIETLKAAGFEPKVVQR